MNLPEATDIIKSIAELVSAIGIPVVAVMQIVNRRAIKEVHLSLNSRLDQLVESKSSVARIEGHAEGVIAGKEEQKRTK